jgi:hypothetical protein
MVLNGSLLLDRVAVNGSLFGMVHRGVREGIENWSIGDTSCSLLSMDLLDFDALFSADTVLWLCMSILVTLFSMYGDGPDM